MWSHDVAGRQLGSQCRQAKLDVSVTLGRRPENRGVQEFDCVATNHGMGVCGSALPSSFFEIWLQGSFKFLWGFVSTDFTNFSTVLALVSELGKCVF